MPTLEPDLADHLRFLRRSIVLARRGALELGTGGPFGALIVRDGLILAEGFNRVVVTRDPTWHAEIEAIRTACMGVVGHFRLDRAILYASGEPCPMCYAAAAWAGIDQIYYASTREDAQVYGDFADLDLYNELARPPDQRTLPCRPVAEARAEALEVWRAYHARPDRVPY